MADLVPGKIDRATLERIMQRAAELQAGEADIGEGLTPDEVTALGREVGIPARYLQQAMLEQATSVVAPAESGVVGSVVGPGEVKTQRVVVGDPDDAARALIDWLDHNELLAVQRQQPGRVTFEPLTGMAAALRRGGAAFSSGAPRFMLSKASVVSAVFTKLESGYCHVAMTANIRQTRGAYLGGGAALGSMGLAGAAVLGALSPFWVVAMAPLLVGGGLGWLVVKQFRPVADRTLLGLERALDFLERGGVKPGHQLPPRSGGIIETIAGEIRKAIASSSERSKPK